MGDPESNPASFLGAELRRARVAAGFSSQEALAAKLGYDRSVIAKAETGERPPSPEVADALQAELFPAGPDGLVIRLATLARQADGPIPSWFESWLEAERTAHMLRLWSPMLVPGLLQIGEYARALFLATGLDEDAAAEHVAVRLGRRGGGASRDSLQLIGRDRQRWRYRQRQAGRRRHGDLRRTAGRHAQLHLPDAHRRLLQRG